MKKVFEFIVVAGLILLVSCGGNDFKQKFAYEPVKPTLDDQVLIKYNPKGTELEGSENVRMVAYYFGKDLINTKAYEMEKEGNGYTAKIKAIEDSKGLLIKFISGEEIDNNNDKGYLVFFNKKDGIVLPGALAGYATAVYSWGYYLDMERDQDLALEKFKEEFTKNPEVKEQFLSNYFSLISRKLKDGANDIIIKELEAIEKKEELTEDDLSLLANWFGRAGETDKAEKYQKQIEEKFPEGVFVQNKEFSKFRGLKTTNERIEFAEKFAADYPESANLDYINNYTVYMMGKNKEYKEAYEFMKKYQSEISPYRNSSIANDMIDADENLDLAKKICKLGIEQAEKDLNLTDDEKPKNNTVKEWKDGLKAAKAMNLSVLANAELKLENNEAALKHSKEAVDLSNGDYKEINYVYAKSLVENLKNEEAMKAIESYIQNGTSTKDMKDLLKKAYVAKNGSEEGYEKYISKYEDLAKQELEEKIKKEMIEKDAPDFTLTDLEGNKVQLADFKGKTLIIDFWATWCGPCKASFPAMQKAVKNYKDNENVKFLFVNTWSRADDKVKDAKDFIEEKGYPFHVVVDIENKVVSDFKVKGVPTKFIVDKNGKIRFESVGFNGEEHLLQELDVLISLLNKA